jgi:hypothetical protein
MVETNPHGRFVDTEVHEAPRQFSPGLEFDSPYELPDRLWRAARALAASVAVVAFLFYPIRALLRAVGVL